jgi:hypothetical protein
MSTWSRLTLVLLLASGAASLLWGNWVLGLVCGIGGALWLSWNKFDRKGDE